MKTLYIDVNTVDNVIAAWRSGQCVAFPTETVYGLGADATNDYAVAQIFAVKGRPQFNPLIVHVSEIAIAKPHVVWSAQAEALAHAFWPGPLTLVLPRSLSCGISPLVSAGGETVAVRVPAHPVAQKLLAAFGGLIAAPSANRSGRISPTTAAHVQEELGGLIPFIVEGGACAVGLESTVVDLTGDAPRLLRPGSITADQLEAVLGQNITPHTQSQSGGLHAPGQLESHYAPQLPVRLNAGQVAADEALLAFGSVELTGAACMRNLSASGDLVEAAAHLFGHLRTLDQPHYRAIAVMPIPETGIGVAINDRLRRAAAGRWGN